jgi:hypothetical protein
MFRFTIRDVLWLTTVVALILGWWHWWRSLPQPDKPVTGTITVAGEPLNDGRISFYSSHGQLRGARVLNGQFHIERIPVGIYQVTIEGENVPALYANMTTQITDGTKTMQYGLHSAEHLARMAEKHKRQADR